jgi:hypothetical protein
MVWDTHNNLEIGELSCLNSEVFGDLGGNSRFSVESVVIRLSARDGMDGKHPFRAENAAVRPGPPVGDMRYVPFSVLSPFPFVNTSYVPVSFPVCQY